ncbi:MULTISPECIES: 2-aminoethylphosphonate ABC transporter substrate-binding protein [Streptomycetaceae]|uniref:Putative ABC transporter substrate-binding protein n=1 Tax=Streptantibioticus cattleyicolor (strain ATCC 35852 / DSM 46488 / JCM 4925 / NBRC 14057 / NRRL 8057) TaxID=1003195 RepID=F8JTC1_STREN|nr:MULTISPECIES: 2-aminoethylphosphonate ABC transporter substrate-binding protein [Streptomycetaceae]AEW94268.1 putative ABC transporter substrate-binding protein [Streptantibioticus cattleyicolor NRRL 8057 = DSM 46488]MYS58925.1 2-aminoethylphosphonate ABC transporter substrate-binding protein [Streptomyces sp. SID5468]CCB74625.1 putative 2-aminoethylphosphonate-binding periplasmic protein [Streptantibioticus cattleyicolor NRRL 8057 = DSM 46488]
MPKNPVTAVLAVLALGASLTACAGTSAAGDAKEITVYSADGLKSQTGDGFYDKVFKDFQARTGIKVDYVEGGSGEMVQRLARERANTQADVVVTLPPFIQQADAKGLLAAYRPAGSDKVTATDKDPDGKWTSVVDNYLCFVYNTKQLPRPPRTWSDLLDPRFKGRIQYSTPGVAGDGTAVLIKAVHDFGGQDKAMGFLKKLQANNVGPSKSTGALAAKVDKGELLVANGDVQMNYADTASMPSQGIFFPAPDGGGRPTTFALPYAAGLVANAPHTANAKKFLDYLLSPEVQREVSAIGGGFPSRTDVHPTDKNADALRRVMSGVDVFQPDWKKINGELDGYVSAWKTATGS